MDYADRRVTVMGLGRFGGGVGVVKFLSSRGAAVTVTDTSLPEDLAASVEAVRDLPGVSLALGEHRERDFRDAELVVANPAVKPTNAYLRVARDAGVPITTEIVLLVRELPNRLRTIGVTGSAGKSTTTAMIGHILRKAFGQEGDTPDPSRQTPGVWVGGNLGGSLLPAVDQIRDDDWAVLELSSFMLHYLREEKWSPHVACLTNFSPNHLDWHGREEDYYVSKFGLIEHQVSGDFVAIGEDAGVFFRSVWEPEFQSGVSGIYCYAESVSQPTRLPGAHNRKNLSLAIGSVAFVPQIVMRFGEIDALHDSALSLIDGFSGLPHRLAYVGEWSSVPAKAGSPDNGEGAARCFNDSKSTTPEAAVLAMEAFEQGAVHAILGGYDKGSDLAEMCRVAAAHCVGVYTIGTTGDAIADAVEAADGIATRCGTLEDAISAIRQRVRPGEVVLLSPGCASWDQFANYEERGDRFVALVRDGPVA
ncbi:MAG: UDP-N-acetylmuramoyl-L-alanine--D-glutamate ligase [Planctomycetota bacterium]